MGECYNQVVKVIVVERVIKAKTNLGFYSPFNFYNILNFYNN